MDVSHVVDQQPESNGFAVGGVVVASDGLVGDRVLVAGGALEPVDQVGHDDRDVLSHDSSVAWIIADRTTLVQVRVVNIVPARLP